MKRLFPLTLLAGTMPLWAAPGDLDPAFSRPQAAKGLYSFISASFSVIPAGGKFLICEVADASKLLPGGFLTRHHEDGSFDVGFRASDLGGFSANDIDGPVRVSVSGLVPDSFTLHPERSGFSVLGFFHSPPELDYSAMSYRVDSSGTGYPVDPPSNIGTGSINDFVIDYDGAVMAWGDFNKPLPSSPTTIFEPLRIGFPWVDKSFTLENGLKWDYCHGITALPDGDFLLQMQVYPDFATGEAGKFHIHRVHGNGGLVSSYEGGSFADPVVQPDGRILVPGGPRVAEGQPVKYLVRLKTDGTEDISFAPDLNGSVESAVLQADGKILVGGGFTAVGGVERRYLARLNSDGTLDTSFTASLNQPVTYVALQGNGKVFAVTTVPRAPEITVTAAVSRHFNDPAVSTLQRPDRSTVRWLRGGSAPEVQVVTVDFRPSSTDEWRSLGKARRITGGWELSDETLPEGGEFSAKGWILGENRRTGWVEATLGTAPPALTLVQWRTLHFGSPDNTGDGADSADADGDGQINLLEYALGQDPKNGTPSPAEAAVWNLSNGALESRFTTTAPTGTPLIFTAEWSENLETGPWQSVTDTGEGLSHILRVTVEGRSKVFTRIRISY